MIIRNYGLFWHREDVFWGRQKRSGHLKGRRTSAVTSDPVNFRDQVGIYGLYDENFRLVYFGQAGRGEGHKLFNRLKDHTNDRIADRWTRFSWFGTKYVKKKDNKLSDDKDKFQGGLGLTLDHMEAIVLAVAEPPHNRQGGRFGKDVEQYIQFRDDDLLGETDKKMLFEIHKSIVTQPE